ncbi:uncharacterized protein L199_008119 [Kwoniella botswanensis]|uniref:uncharacterized protein n=1 Tax=Kwoniella botswanensis TaxID=1268659 RepID=UPI00315C8787
MAEKNAATKTEDAHLENRNDYVNDEPESTPQAVHVIHNPLKRDSPEQVVADAQAFANNHNLGEYADLFGRAALVARDQHNFHNIPGLSSDEVAALQYERDHKWHGPRMLWFSVGLCAIGAATQGWDQTGSNGANLSFPQEFGIAGSGGDEWKVGLVNSIIFLTAGLIGAFITDPLNHYLGRRGEIFLTSACLTATPIASGFAKSWQTLFAIRFVMGIGIGAKNATVPIFSAELAPARVRGALTMFWQLWVVAGIFLGFAANCIVKDTGRIAWRLQLGSAFIPAFILMCGIYLTPESPRWLMKHKKYDKAFRSFLKIRAHPIIAARDYYYSYVIYLEEIHVAEGSNYFTRMRDIFTVPRIRRANYGASTAMLAQQMCGINIISFYSSTIFTDVGYTDDQALFASLGYGAVQVIFTIPTLFLIDTVGRRRLCLITFPLMCIFLLAAGLSVLKTSGSQASRVGPVVLFVYLFTICYSLGEGPVAFQYSAEVFPTIQREQGMAFVVFINNFFAGVLGLTFPRMRTVMTTTGAFGFYAGLNLIAWFMVFCFIRETKQLTLEELDQVFSVPTSEYFRHEATVSAPWFIKRYFFFQKHLPKPPSIIATATSYPSHGGKYVDSPKRSEGAAV